MFCSRENITLAFIIASIRMLMIMFVCVSVTLLSQHDSYWYLFVFHLFVRIRSEPDYILGQIWSKSSSKKAIYVYASESIDFISFFLLWASWMASAYIRSETLAGNSSISIWSTRLTWLLCLFCWFAWTMTFKADFMTQMSNAVTRSFSVLLV